MTKRRSFLEKMLAGTAIAGVLGLGIGLEKRYQELPILTPAAPSAEAYNPVNGPDSEFINSPLPHIGGMRDVMDKKEDNIFDALAKLPENERVLRVGIITQPEIPQAMLQYDVQPNEYIPVSDNAKATLSTVLDEFTAMTGVPTEIVENNYSAHLILGAFSSERQTRQGHEQENTPELVVAEGFAAKLGQKVQENSSARQGLVAMHQNDKGNMSYNTLWHELLHDVVHLSHSLDEHGTLGNFHDEDGKTFLMPLDQQGAVSIMSYNRIVEGPGALDRYLVRAAMEDAGLTPPEAEISTTSLNRQVAGELDAEHPAESISVQPESTINGTGQSDALVTDAGMCGFSRYELFNNKKLYCVVEGFYSDVHTGAGEDLVLASRIHDQTIHLGEDENRVLVLDENSGHKTIRHETEANPADKNTLVLADNVLEKSEVNVRQTGDAIVLEFGTDGEVRTRITLEDQLTSPVINEFQIITRMPETNRNATINIDISAAKTPDDFRQILTEGLDQAREQARERFDDLSYRVGEVEIPSPDASEREMYGVNLTNAFYNWTNEMNNSEEYDPKLTLNLTVQPAEPEPKKGKPVLFSNVSTVEAAASRNTGREWKHRTEGKNAEASHSI